MKFFSMSFVFIYKKGKDFKVLDIDSSKLEAKNLLKLGWEHICTMNSSVWINHILNCEEKYLLKEIKDVKKL